MSWVDRNLPWLLLALIVAASLALVGAIGVGVVLLLQGLLAGAALSALLGDLALVVGAVTLLGALDVAFVVALVVTVLRRASFPTDERLAARFETAERWVPPLRDLALSERFAPSVEERRQRLQERYVDGELSEIEFERRLDDLLDEAEGDDASVDRERDAGDPRTPPSGRRPARSDVDGPEDRRSVEPGRVREEE